jgi:hypothetical protein
MAAPSDKLTIDQQINNKINNILKKCNPGGEDECWKIRDGAVSLTAGGYMHDTS